MRTKYVWMSAAGGFLLCSVVGCGSADTAPDAPVVVPETDGGAPPRVTPADPDGGRPEGFAVGSEPFPERDAAPPPASPRCIPRPGPDLPDDEFLDSNCDGIDGDRSAALFVSTAGSDDADGSLEHPLRTLSRAVASASAAKKSIYVCDGTYEESLTLAGTAVDVFGGFDCEQGGARGLDRARIAPKSGVPLVVSDVAKPLVLDRLEFVAPDGAAPSESSVAASVYHATDVTLSRVTLTAGNGADGAKGQDGANVAGAADGGLGDAGAVAAFPSPAPGTDSKQSESQVCDAVRFGTGVSPRSGPECAQVPAGGLAPFFTCPNGAIVLGGRGGNGGNFALGLEPGDGVNGVPTAGPALDGESGRAGAPGAPGRSLGSLVRGTYVADNGGSVGAFGHAGQAGRGGKGGDSNGSPTSPLSHYAVGGGGGQGGYPGCGGAGGLPGTAGGASIGLVSQASTLLLRRCTISAGQGGRGGDGGDGAPGTPGTEGGAGGHASRVESVGSRGGRGGRGGFGGPGGPGGGGPAIGVLVSGAVPTLIAVTMTPGTPGAGGVSSGATGIAGLSGEMRVMADDSARGVDGGAP